MKRTIFLIAFLSVAGHIYSQTEYLPLSPGVILPEKYEFKTWENLTRYTKTYVVDRKHPDASDNNTGDETHPFLTINKAAQVVKAGERVLIRSGIYREKVVPRYSGKNQKQMICYEAAPGAEVVIKGSRILTSPWVRSLNPAQFSEKLWMTTLADSLFPEISPFKLENASTADIEIMPWAAEWVGRPPYTNRRGMVFQNGRRLSQLAAYEDLVRLPGSFWIDATGTVLHIHPFDEKNPNNVTIEITVQQHLFKPDETDLAYIQVKGITFMHAGNGLPRTGTGALFTMGGHHWLIEENRFEGMNSVAIEIGARSIETKDRELSRKDGLRARHSPGHTIVRNNVISDCGTGGIQGMVNNNALVEKNHLYNIGWMDVERYWECAAIKLLISTRTLVRRNLIHDVMAAAAIWLDWSNSYNRITQNTIFDVAICCNGTLFIEASRAPNLMDHNIIWDIHGIAISGGDSDSLIIAHNLIGPCTNTGVYTKQITDRILQGREMTSRYSRVVNNIFYTEDPIFFGDPENISDMNLFKAGFGLSKRQQSGFDASSQVHDFNISFDREKLELTFEGIEDFPLSGTEPFFEFDFFNNRRHAKAYAGPFQKIEKVLAIDPRR
jgi:alpha-N-arabinofuranosidase